MAAVTVRTRKFMTNRLLARKQMVVDILHPSAVCPSKEQICEKLATICKTNAENVICYGFKTQFGGGKTTGFALAYDNLTVCKKFEPKYRLYRKKILEKPKSTITRKAKKMKKRQAFKNKKAKKAK